MLIIEKSVRSSSTSLQSWPLGESGTGRLQVEALSGLLCELKATERLSETMYQPEKVKGIGEMTWRLMHLLLLQRT